MTFNHVWVHYAAWAAWISSRSNAVWLFALRTLAILSEANGSGDLRNFKGDSRGSKCLWGVLIWILKGLMGSKRVDHSHESWVELFSISKLFFGDWCKICLIYRVVTAKNMRPLKVTWLGRKGDLVRFFEYFLVIIVIWWNFQWLSKF